MLFSSWLRNSKRSATAAHGAHKRPFASGPNSARGRKRWKTAALLSGYQQTNLVGYKPGIAHFTDSNLNGWGMASMPDGPFVVANTFTTGLATFYSRSGHVLPQTITIPGSASPVLDQALGIGPGGHPTGVVYNPTNNFVISANGKSAPARLIFDSIDGTISGWNPEVDPTHAIVMVDNGAAGDAYTGLEMAQNSQGKYVLYATDFTQNRVEMFNGDFKPIGSFTDPSVTSIEPSFGAWSVQAVGGKLYVTFAVSGEYAWRRGGRVRYRRQPADAQPFRRQRLRRGPAGKPLGDHPGSGELRRVQPRPADRQRGGGRQHQRL